MLDEIKEEAEKSASAPGTNADAPLDLDMALLRKDIHSADSKCKGRN